MGNQFIGEGEGACESCGDTRVLDKETMLCKDCWRDWRNDQEDDNEF
jgi:ribosomal protein S14